MVSPALRAPGEKEILVTVQEGDASDLLVGTLRVPAPAAAPVAGDGLQRLWALLQNSPLRDVKVDTLPVRPEVVALGTVLIAGFLLGAVFRARPKTMAAIFLVGLVTVIATTGVRAHEGHDHGPEPAAGTSGNAPGRWPDGSIRVDRR